MTQDLDGSGLSILTNKHGNQIRAWEAQALTPAGSLGV